MRASRVREDPASFKTPTNLSLDAAVVAEAKALGVNLSQACERGLRERVREVREQAWLAENADAIASSNAYFEEHGLPLAKYRQV